jgi:hypothetical protein
MLLGFGKRITSNFKQMLSQAIIISSKRLGVANLKKASPKAANIHNRW